MKYLSPLFFFVIFVGIVIFFIIESAFNRGVYINNKFPELNEAIVNIQYKTTLAHLSLEELLSGDSTEDLNKLKGYIRAGKHYLNILINADSFKYENKELESILDALEVNMNEFEKLTLERYHNKEIAKIGTDFDYKYDIVFKKVLANCSRIEYYTNSMNEQALNEYNVQRYILFGIFFFLMLLSLLYIYSNTRKSIKETKHILSVQKKLEQSLNLFDTNVIASKTNLQGIITDVSQAFLDISGYTKTEMLGSSHNIVRHKDMTAEVFADMWQTIQSGKTWEGEIKNKHKDGSFYWVYSYINPIKIIKIK